MCDTTIDIIMQIGALSDVVLEVDVNWSFTDQGDVDIDDYYAYHVTEDNTGHRDYDRVPHWMHKLIKHELAEYHEAIVNSL